MVYSNHPGGSEENRRHESERKFDGGHDGGGALFYRRADCCLLDVSNLVSGEARWRKMDSESLMIWAMLKSNNTIRFLTIILVYGYFLNAVDRLTAYTLAFTVVGNSYRPIAIKNNYNKMCSRYGLKQEIK